MSVHRIERNGSVVWRVRWREGGRGSRSRTRTFDRKADAVAFEDELRRRRRLGELGLLPGSQETLDEYVCQTWAQTHAVTLAPKTARDYAGLYDVHIAPHLGQHKLAELTPDRLAEAVAATMAKPRPQLAGVNLAGAEDTVRVIRRLAAARLDRR